jgi:hypothetical protein
LSRSKTPTRRASRAGSASSPAPRRKADRHDRARPRFRRFAFCAARVQWLKPTFPRSSIACVVRRFSNRITPT